MSDNPQDAILPYLEDLDQDTRGQLENILSSLVEIKDADQAPRQVREIEPVRSWLKSNYYNSFSRSLFPYWVEEIADFCENGYNEWVITGSIGTGKSTAALVTKQRKVYELSCYEQPQRLFRLADMTKIFFAYLSVNLKQAELTGFGQFREMINQTPYFQTEYQRDKKIQTVLKFPGNVFVIPGSDALSFIGTNLFGVVLDEINFLRQGGQGTTGNVAKAQTIYQEATDRRRSRFMYQGKDPGFSLLVSSSTVQTSFTSSRIKAAEKEAARGGRKTTKVTNTKLWEVKPPGTYSKKVFYVFNGSEREDAFLIEDPRDVLDLIELPSERKHFEGAIEAALQADPTGSPDAHANPPPNRDEKLLDPQEAFDPYATLYPSDFYIQAQKEGDYAYPQETEEEGQGWGNYSDTPYALEGVGDGGRELVEGGWTLGPAALDRGHPGYLGEAPSADLGALEPEERSGLLWEGQPVMPRNPVEVGGFSGIGVPYSPDEEEEGGLKGPDERDPSQNEGDSGIFYAKKVEHQRHVRHDHDLLFSEQGVMVGRQEDPQKSPSMETLSGEGPKRHAFDSNPEKSGGFSKIERHARLVPSCPLGGNPWMDRLWGYLPEYVQHSISRVPVDFRASFDGDLYQALKNIAGVSIAPMGKLFTSRSLWNRACAGEGVPPKVFSKETFEITLSGQDSILDFFRADLLFDGAGNMIRDPYSPRYLRVDQSKNTDCTGIACVHRAGWTFADGAREPLIEVDFVIKITPPPKPDRIGFYKIRSFILALREMGMKIGGVSFDQYQSEDHQQLLAIQGFKTSYLSVDRDDKAYLTMVNLLNEGRVKMYPYEPVRKEFFNLDWDRDKGKVDHPQVNPDGTKGSKDGADALVGAVFECVNGINTSVPVRQEVLDEVRTVGPTLRQRYEGGRDFDWVLPPQFRGKVEIEVQKVGAAVPGIPEADPEDDERW